MGKRMALHSFVMAERSRRTLVNVRLSDAEIAMLHELSERTGLNQSDVLRQLIRHAHADEPKRKPPAKKRKK
jgi:ribosomal 50S subunit-associated protein YjgA (DUF615 family)